MAIIAKYKFDSSLCSDYLPEFNSTFTGYTVSDINNGDNTITRTISHDTLKPTAMRFGTTTTTSDREKSLLEVMECDTSQVTSMTGMFQGCSSITSLNTSSFDTSKVNNMFAMFQGCTLLTLLNVSSFNTSRVTNMSKMFYGCNKLNSLDLSNFDTSNVTTMSYMFANCSSLTLLNVSSFNTGKATEMNWMFSNCGKLTSLNLSNFNTGKVKLMDNMFNGCGSLASLNVSSFNTSESTTMVSMFQSCKSLIVLDLSNFDTNKVTNMVSMFFGCSSLISLNISSFNTSQVIDMANMFQYCSALTSLDLSNFDTNKLTSMANMFNACNKLNSLDLSSFNTNSVTNMNAMFANCGKLTSLDLSNFDTSKVTDMNSMFGNCSLLSDIGLLYATPSTINSLLPHLGTTVARNIYYIDAPLNELTVQDNITYKEYKLSSSVTFQYTLNKLPNGVADYIDVVNKVHVQRVGKFVADGVEDTLALETYNVGEGYIKFKTEAFISRHADGAENFICDKLPYNSKSHNNSNEVGFRGAGGNSPYWIMFCIEDAPLATKDLNGLRAYLQSNPITVLYELATPIYTPLTDEEIAQLPLSAYKDGYINLSSNQLTPSMDLRMRASNRYQVDMLETGYYYLNAPVGNVKLGTANVDVAQMPCIIKVDNVGTGDSGYRLGLSNGVRESIINLTFGMYINNNNGNALASPQDAYTPDYLSLEDYGLTTLFSLVPCEDMVAGSDGYGIIFVLFNEEKNLIRAFVSETGIINEAIPAEAKYFKLSIRTRNSNNPKAKITNSTPLVLAKLPSYRIPTSFTQGMKCGTDFGYWEGIKNVKPSEFYVGENNRIILYNVINELNRIEYGNTIVEDEFDIATGKLTRRIGKYTIDGNSKIYEYSYNNDTALYKAYSIEQIPNMKQYSRIANFIFRKGSGTPQSTIDEECWQTFTSDCLYFRCRKDRFSQYGNGADGVKAYFNANPVTIYYELEMPEISYINLPKNYVETLDGSTTLQCFHTNTNASLNPQVKPSYLSYQCILTPSTQYTVFHNRKNYDGSSKLLTIDLGGTQVVASGSRTVVTTPSTLSHSELRFIGGENTVEQVMVLHGDWTKDNKDVDYFEGIQHSIIGDKILENLVGDPIRVNISTTKDIVSVNDAINDDKVHTRDGLFKSAILKGNTLVNLVKDSSEIKIVGKASSTLAEYQVNHIDITKDYTVLFEINDFNGSGNISFSLGTQSKGVSLEEVNHNGKFNILIPSSKIGSEMNEIWFYWTNGNWVDGNSATIKNIVLIEGDYTNVDIPYFEGMQSVKMPVLKSIGKNLFEGEFVLGEWNGIRIIESLNRLASSKLIEVRGGSTLTLSSQVYQIRMLTFLDENKKWIGHSVLNDSNTLTAKTPNNCKYIGFNLRKSDNTNFTEDEIKINSNVMVEYGTQATPFEPYKTSILSLPEEVELRGIGDVKDELNLITGELTERIEEVIFNSSNGWIKSDSSFNTVYEFKHPLQRKGKNGIVISNNFVQAHGGDYERVNIYTHTDTTHLFLCIDKSKLSSNLIDALNDYLQSNPITVQYQLETESVKTVDLTSSGNWEKVVLDGDDNIALSLWDSNSNGKAPDVQGVYTTNSFTDAIPQAKVIASGIKADFLGVSDYNNETCFMSGTQKINFNIFKDKLSSPTVEGVKEYLKSNPITVWYQTTSHKDSTQVKQPLLFKDGHIKLSSGGLLPNAELTVPTTNKYQLDLDRLKYTVITKQGFTFNGNDYSASATGLNVIDVVDVIDNALYSDDENITVIQENANSYEDGILTQFKGLKVFAKNFIGTTNNIKRSAMKMVEPLELQGIPGGATDTYDVLTGVVTRRVNSLHFKDLTYQYSSINSDTYKKYSYMVYSHNLLSLANANNKYISNILPAKEMNVDSTERGFYFSSGNQLVVWQIGNEVDTLKQYLEENDFTVTFELKEPQIIKPDEMKPYVSTRPEKGSIESLDSKLQAEYLDYDNEQYILSPRMLGEGDTIRWEQGSQCYVFENDKEYIPLEDYREPFGFNLDAKDVEQYIENVEGAEVELGIALKEKGVYERTFASHEDSVIYPTELDNIDEQRGTEVEYICGATWQNPNDLSDIRHVGTLRPDGQYDVNIVRSGDDEIRLLDGTTNISLNGDGLNPSEFELTYFNDGGAELGKYGDTSHTLEGTVKDSKLATGTVYGETLVNLLDTKLFYNSSSTVTRDSDGWITVPGNGTYVLCGHAYQGNLKTDTLYTLIVDVKSNTCSGALYLIDKSGGGNPESAFTIQEYYIPSKATGRFTKTITTKSDLSGVICDFRAVLSAKATTGESIVFRYMLLEGDYTSYPMDIPYFEGVGSTIVNGFTITNENLFHPSRMIIGDGSLYGYFKFKNYDDTKYTLSLTIKDFTVDTSDIYFGFSERGIDHVGGVSWLNNTNYAFMISIRPFISIYPNTREALERLMKRYDIKLEKGETKTPYNEPVIPTQYTLPTPITLNKVGDVADTYDVVSRVQTCNTKKVMASSLTWENTFFSDSTCYRYRAEANNVKSKSPILTLQYNHYGDDINTEGIREINNSIYFQVSKDKITTNLKDWLKDNDFEIAYQLKTPTTIQHTLIPSHLPVEYPTFILPQQLRSVPNGICDRLYWDENKGHYCIEKRIYDYTITGANDVGLMDSGTSLMVYAYGDTSITDGVLNLNSGNVSQAPSYSYNNKFGNKVFDVITGGSTVEAISPFNGHMYYRLLASRVGTTLDSIKAWFNENPTTVYMPLATPQIIDLPHLNRKLELPTLVDGLPLGFKVEHEKVNPQLGLTIPYKVLNMPKQPTDLSFVMRDNQIGDYILTWSEIKEARQYNIILNDDVIATTKEPSYNTGEEIYGYILVEAQNELGENLSKELYVKTVPNAPAQLTVAHNPMTDSYDFDITFISTSAIADYYTIKYCVDDGEWVVHDIQATDIELDSKVLYQFSVFSIEDNIKVHATATNDIGTNDILPVATYYMSPTPQWTYRINSKEAFIRWIDNSPYDVKYKVRYSYLSEGVYKYAYFEGDTSEVGKMYELMLPLAEDDELTVSICIVSDKENLYCKPVKMSKSLDPNIVPPLNFKYRWLARGLVEFSWEDNYEVDVKYEYVLEHKLADADVWEAINEEIVAEDVAGIGTVYRLEYQLQDLEQIRVKVRMLWAMNETEWTETLATVFIPVEGNPPTWIKRTQTQEGLLVQWEAQAYVDSYHVYITDSEGTVLQHIETLDDFILLDIDYDNPIELHIYEKTRFSGGIESDPTDEMVFTPTSYRTTHLMNVYKPCAEEYEMEVATIQKGSKEVYVINDVTYTPNVKATGDLVTSISSPFQISYHPLGIDVHQAGSKAYAPLDLSVRTLDVRNKYQFDIMTFERITDKYDMNFNVYTPSVMSYPITLEVSKVRIVCLGDSLTSGHPYYWAETGTGMIEASYPYQLSRRLKNQYEVINSGYGYFM